MHVLSFSRVFLQDPARIKIDVPLETEWYRWCSFIAVSKYQMPNCSFDKARRYKGLNITSWWNVSEWWIPVTNIPKCSLFKHFFLQPWSWKFYIKEIIHRGKNMNATLKIYVYTNKSTKFGGRNDTLAASEVSIFAKHLLQSGIWKCYVKPIRLAFL